MNAWCGLLHDDEQLITEDKFAFEFFAIKNGTAEIVVDGNIARTLGPGEFFGEVALLVAERRPPPRHDVSVPSPELSEIVAPSGRGRTFELSVRGGLADTTPTGRVRLDVIAGWLQDVARADVDDALQGDEWLWVVRRTRIHVDAFPRWGEICTARSWCSGTGAMWAERRTSITGPTARVETVGLWVRIDEERGRPIPPGERCVAVYQESANGRRVKARLRHPGPPPDAACGRWRFRASELDMADHVNNSAYWAIVEEELAEGAEPVTFDGEIEFRAGAQPGDAIVLSDGPLRWVQGADGELSASVLLTAW